MKEYEIVMMDIFHIGVCTEKAENEALEWVRKTNAAGTTANWGLVDYKEYPQKSPIQCNACKKRKHYMFMC